jgi:polyphosphate kinase
MILKMNSLVDKKMIRKLYQASQAGVQVDLLVRGISCLKTGLPEISENIRIVSVLGRYLEHSRIYYFENNGKPKILMGSADLMPRNLNNRIEVLFPIENQGLIKRVKKDILDIYLKPDTRSWEMNSDGSYTWRCPDPENCFDIQDYFRKKAAKRKL